MKLLILIGIVSVISLVSGHGRLNKPPGRGSAWRFGFNTPRNYNDNENNCGGLGNQVKNGMKCGVCGDRYEEARPRRHENGGKFGTGTIVGHYSAGQTIDVEVYLSANHLGHFEFHLCPITEKGQLEEEECFKNLQLENGSDKVPVPASLKYYKGKVRLPAGVTCDQCVFRWFYVAGNNWGGSNTNQEHFINCADISIQ